MKILACTFALFLGALATEASAQGNGWVLVIHGGASAPSNMSPEEEAEYVNTMGLALDTGAAVLTNGGSSLDAVTESVKVLEDSPLFNAGRGSVFNADGVNEMDAAIMNGPDRRAGAVAAVKSVRNPILAARAVLEKGGAVLLVGDSADRFAEENGLPLEAPYYFFVERRWQAYLKARDKAERGENSKNDGDGDDDTKGTVGAIALDINGALAAATSTGGLTYKPPGRVGDSPVIGGGTYADPTCAASGTGKGEAFIRATATRSVCAAMAAGDTPDTAADRILADIASLGGDGGLIVLDAKGNAAMRFNSKAMFRGQARSDGTRTVAFRPD